MPHASEPVPSTLWPSGQIMPPGGDGLGIPDLLTPLMVAPTPSTL